MNSLSETLKLTNSYQLVSTDINNNSISTDTTDKKYDCDHLFEMLPDLVDNNWRAWYCSMFYKLGKDQVLRIASVSRQEGKNPRKLFSFMLRQAVK